MNNLPLQPLVWGVDEHTGEPASSSVLHGYIVMNDGNGKFKVAYYLLSGGTYTKFATGFATIDEAKSWAWGHYNEKMQPYVKPDSITDIVNWFKEAKPEPTKKDVCTQIGCHFEEVSEMNEAILGVDTWEINALANHFKYASKLPRDTDKTELLDALCDQIVTATGVAYMMGFDINGALKEVNASNWSKFVNGKAMTDENGKIIKGSGYFKPELGRFVGGSEND